ncbi:MAG: S1C family serine protease [Actinomycetota bacterium]|nr:S1C family serine protease [Actinomycetota bacterium]
MAAVDEWEAVVARVAAVTGPGAVRIGRDGGRGAGVVVRDGLVVTSAHNLRGGTVTVSFAGGRSMTGQVRAADVEGDLAVVEADTAGTTPVPWEPSTARLGQVVLAVGPGRARGTGRVTVGRISAVDVAFRGPRGRLIENGFEHTALVGRGSSGGPVVDAGGRLVGINTHRPEDGLYLAIPADQALADRVDALARGEAPSRRRLGLALVPPPVAQRLRAAVGLEPRDGLLIRQVDADGPAGAAGVRAGDLIVRAGGAEVVSVDGLVAAVEAHPDAETMTIGLVRGAEEITVEVRFPPTGAA